MTAYFCGNPSAFFAISMGSVGLPGVHTRPGSEWLSPFFRDLNTSLGIQHIYSNEHLQDSLITLVAIFYEENFGKLATSLTFVSWGKVTFTVLSLHTSSKTEKNTPRIDFLHKTVIFILFFFIICMNFKFCIIIIQNNLVGNAQGKKNSNWKI